MNWRAIALLTVFVLGTVTACTDSGSGPAPRETTPGVVSVDVLYLDHPPVQPVLEDVNEVLAKYDGKLAVNRVVSDSPEGEQLAEELGLGGHLALAVAIDGSVEVDVDGRRTRFEGFPSGQSPIASQEGEWALDDLDSALAQRTRRVRR